VTVDEIRKCAEDMLAFFMETMPDVPFTGDDIIIEFAKKKDMARRARQLCKKYFPDKTINESQARLLNRTIAAKALVGREKSAVLVCEEFMATIKEWRMLFFHELMHIYCGKTEVDGKHFMDIYGNVYTPNLNPENKIYDGCINSGYIVWSEFIAQYYALIKASGDNHDYIDVRDYVNRLLCDVNIATNELSNASFAMACAYILTCSDFDDILNPLNEPDGSPDAAMPYENENKAALLDCLRYLFGQLQREKPWKINEEFIEMFGLKYLTFKTINSLYLARIKAMEKKMKNVLAGKITTNDRRESQ